MPTEQTLAPAENKIWTDIKVEMDKQGYTTTILAKFLNVNRPTISFASHGGTTSRDVEIRKNLSHFWNGVKVMDELVLVMAVVTLIIQLIIQLLIY